MEIKEIQEWVAGWANRHFFGRGSYQRTSAGAASRGLPLVLDANGKIDLSFQQRGAAIGARVYNSAAISTTSGVVSVLTFDMERYDTTAMHSTSSSTSRITAPYTGKYSIGGTITFANNVTGVRILYIQHNGSVQIARHSQDAVSGVFETNMSIATEYALTAGDYVELAVFQSSGGALNITATGATSPEFYMSLITS